MHELIGAFLISVLESTYDKLVRKCDHADGTCDKVQHLTPSGAVVMLSVIVLVVWSMGKVAEVSDVRAAMTRVEKRVEVIEGALMGRAPYTGQTPASTSTSPSVNPQLSIEARR